MAMSLVQTTGPWAIARPHSADPFTRWPVYAPQEYSVVPAVALDIILGLDQECQALNLNQSAVLDDWVRRCPDCNPHYVNYVPQEALRRNLDSLFRMIEQLDPHDPSNGVQTYLMHQLERAKHEDVVQAYGQPPGITVYCQHMFRSLAYVSYKCRSVQIGLVLSEFFRRNVRWIASLNSCKALWQWCQAIVVSSMPELQKHHCLSMLRMHRPEVFDLSRTRNDEGTIRGGVDELVEELIDILNERLPSRLRRQYRGLRSEDRSDDEYNQSDHRGPKTYREAARDVRYLERKLENSKRALTRFEDETGHPYGDGRSWRRRFDRYDSE